MQNIGNHQPVMFQESAISADLKDRIQGCVTRKEWHKILETLKYYPKSHLSDLLLDNGATLLLQAAKENQWECVKEMLASNPPSNINATFHKESSLHGQTILWLAVKAEQSDIVMDILNDYPHVDLDATCLGSNDYAGVNVLLLAISEAENYKIADKLLDINPHLNVNATYTQYARHTGITPFSHAVRDGNWQTAWKMALHNPHVDYYATCKSFGIFKNTPLFNLADANKWDFIAKLINHSPKAQPSKNLFKDRDEGKRLLSEALEFTPVHKVGYCSVLLGAADSSFSNLLKLEIDKHFDKCLTCLEVPDSNSYNLFAALPSDIQNLCLINALQLDFPEISGLPCHVLSQILSDKAAQAVPLAGKSLKMAMGAKEIIAGWRKCQRKSREFIAKLSFVEFRRNNGLVLHPFTRGCIKDFYNMITDALDKHNGAYEFALRQRIIRNISEKRSEPLSIDQGYIDEAIASAIKG